MRAIILALVFAEGSMLKVQLKHIIKLTSFVQYVHLYNTVHKYTDRIIYPVTYTDNSDYFCRNICVSLSQNPVQKITSRFYATNSCEDA